MVHSDPAVTRACPSPWQNERKSKLTLEQHYLLEVLERRVLLSAAFVPTSTNLHDIQNGPLAKAGGNLADLYLNYRSAQRAGTLTAFEKQIATETASPYGSPIDAVGNTVGVEVVGSGKFSAFEQQMESLGLSVQAITPSDNAIAGFIPITLLSQLAQSSDVLHVTPLDAPSLRQEGESPNQADQGMQAVEARSTDGLTGAGVTVGVISDSVSQFEGGLADSVGTGDLPKNVKVIQDGAAGSTDEGRAILEQIYDLAPGANLVFDAVGTSQQSFANAIAALQAAGCNVIIDDVGFYAEPYFQPGVIDQAIDNAVNNGVTYVTAAGNNGNSGFEQAASFVAATDGTGDQLVNFNAGGTAATRMNITVTQEGIFTLEWDDAYDGVTGTVNADLNVYLYAPDGREIVFAGADNAFATGQPIQQFIVLPGTYQVEIRAVNTPVADLPGHYEFTIDTDDGDAISYTQYPGLQTSVVGHSAFSEGISVGAVDYANSPAFSSLTPVPTEPFSSAGPAVQVRDANGNLLPTPVTVDVPEVSGTDGNDTSFFGEITPEDPTKFPQFFGTSSASGNLAGCVALLKQADPSATPAQILAALEATALPLNGQASGTYNTTGGYGLVDTVAAAAKLIAEEAASGGGGAAPPVATIEPVDPDPRAKPVSSIDIDFSQAVSGFDLADLSLTLNGGANLLTGGQTLTSTNNQDFVLGNLSSVTTAYGNYELALTGSGSGITGADGAALVSGATTFFVVEAVPGIPLPPTISAVTNSNSSVQLTLDEAEGGQTGFILERSTNSLFTGKVTTKYLAANTTNYTDSGLVPGTVYYYRDEAYNPDGSSLFSHAATAITLAAGEVILDEGSASGVTVTGAWASSTAGAGYEGPDYLQDDDSGKGTKSVTFRPDLSAVGEYNVYATWTTGSDRSTKVPFEIYSKNGDHLQTVYENERSTGGSGWVLIGEFFLHSSTASFVRISNAGTQGQVIANAIKFLPVNDIEREDGLLVLNAPATTESVAAAATRPVAAAVTSEPESNELMALREEVE